MTATQIHLDQVHLELLQSLTEKTGEPVDVVVQAGLELFAEKLQSSSPDSQPNWLACLKSAEGMWKDRDDLPDLNEQRKESSRY